MFYEHLIWIVAGCMFAALTLSIAGIPAYLRRDALIGDAMSHSIFPGVVLSVWLFGAENSLALYITGTCIGGLALLLINSIQKNTIIPKDAAIGIILIVFFSAGLLLMGQLQRSGIPLWGVQHVLLGKAATILPSDVAFLFSLFSISAAGFFIFQKWIWLQAFDPKFAQLSGINLRTYSIAISLWTAFVLTATVHILGAILSAAMLLTPSAIGHFIRPKPSAFVQIALGSCMISSVGAGFVSASLPAMSTGALMVIMLFGIACPVFLFYPQKGILMKSWSKKQESKRWEEENALKYILNHPLGNLPAEHLKAAKRCYKMGLAIECKPRRWNLTAEGKIRAERIVRKHRLWETYLHQRLSIAVDRVHENAEWIEHLLDDEFEDRIAQELKHPKLDPHASPIPPKIP